MTINSKQKGKRGELELVKEFKKRGYEARRGQQFKGTPDSPDILIDDLPNLHTECKRVEALNLYKAYEQACNDKGEKQTPVVFHRKTRKEWLAVLSLNDFFKLLKNKDMLK